MNTQELALLFRVAAGSDLYGTSESTTVYSGYIGVGEMWGYFMGEAMLAQ